MKSTTRQFLKEHAEEAELLASGKVKCSVTGHEMPCELEVLERYWKGKALRRARLRQRQDLFDAEELDPNGYIKPSKDRASTHVYCELTQQTLRRDPDEVRRHVNGRRYKILLAEKQKQIAEEERREEHRRRESGDSDGEEELDDEDDDGEGPVDSDVEEEDNNDVEMDSDDGTNGEMEADDATGAKRPQRGKKEAQREDVFWVRSSADLIKPEPPSKLGTKRAPSAELTKIKVKANQKTKATTGKKKKQRV